jgi:hypothetical protein
MNETLAPELRCLHPAYYVAAGSKRAASLRPKHLRYTFTVQA